MENFKKMVRESEGPMDLSNMKSSPLFNLNEEVNLGSMVEKLIHAANVIIDHRIAVGLGLETNKNAIYYNSKESEWILKQVEPMMKSVQQTKKIKAEHMKDVTKLVEKGKISLNEAKEMMDLIQQQNAMDLLDELN